MVGIIDMHTHMFPEDVIHNWNKYAERDYYFKLLTDPKNSSIQQYATAEEAIKLADKAGVEKIVMQGWYWNDHELCKYHNDYMYEIINKYPDRFEALSPVREVNNSCHYTRSFLSFNLSSTNSLYSS